MRVTSRSMVDTVVRNLQQNAQSLDRLQNQISSNKRLHRPSDDPAAIWRSLSTRREHAGNEQLLRNMDDSNNWLVLSGQALSGTQQTLAKIRELAVQASDDSYSSNDRAAIAREVKQLKDHVLSLFNSTNYVGQSLFSGRKTNVSPFTTDAGGNVLYNGETGVTIPAASTDLNPANGIRAITLTDATSATQGTYRASIAAPVAGVADLTITRYDSTGVAVPGATQTVSVTVPAGADLKVLDFASLGLTVTVDSTLGTVPFLESATSEFTVGEAEIAREIGPGVNLPVNMLGSKFLTMFQDLGALEKALTAANQPEISKGIANLDAAVENVLVAQAEMGTRMNRLETAVNRLAEADTETLRIQRDVEDIDMAEALTRLTTQQTVYRAALQTGAASVQLSLLDFLR